MFVNVLTSTLKTPYSITCENVYSLTQGYVVVVQLAGLAEIPQFVHMEQWKRTALPIGS